VFKNFSLTLVEASFFFFPFRFCYSIIYILLAGQSNTNFIPLTHAYQLETHSITRLTIRRAKPKSFPNHYLIGAAYL